MNWQTCWIGPVPSSLSGSRWAWEVAGHTGGSAPELDLTAHAALLELVLGLVADQRVVGIHDAADGLGVALVEMAVRSGVGCTATSRRTSGCPATWTSSASRCTTA